MATRASPSTATAWTTRSSRGAFTGLGPATDWISLRVPVVAGEEPSPLQRVAAAADFGNGVSATLPGDAHLHQPRPHRDPGPPGGRRRIGVDATTRLDAGVGTTEAVLWDERGRLGRSVQTLLVERR